MKVQKDFSRCVLRLRERRIPLWKQYIQSAQKREVKVKAYDLIRIRNAALHNLSKISDFLKQGAKVKQEENFRDLMINMLYVILNTTVLLEKCEKEKKHAPPRVVPQIISPGKFLEPRDLWELGIDSIRIKSEES